MQSRASGDGDGDGDTALLHEIETITADDDHG